MTDANSLDTTEVRGSCSWCEGSLRTKHYVQVAGSSTFLLCSEDCLRAKMRDDALRQSTVRRRRLRRFVVGTTLVGACITPHEGPPSRRTHPVVHAIAAANVTPLPGSFGPEWPPSESSLLAELGRDAWLHPLAGPFRRMPERDSRVFGAERPGDRPIECRRGHCGVDLGGEIWGEYVRAAHDGTVDRVQRAANDLHGGHYVRLSHRNDTVFTQYFHLAAIPRGLAPGVPVKAGDVIGLLGDTGVKESMPHLHFTVSVRPAKDWPEQYVDPEPLVALWPLRIPLQDSPVSLVSTAGKPGVPLGSPPGGAARSRELALRKRTAKAAAKNEEKGSRKHGPGAAVKKEASSPDDPAEDEPAAESSAE